MEGVFLVSGVVKTVFWRFKKKVREFFCFSPRTKGGKAGLRGNFQITTFPYGNAENMFYNFVVLVGRNETPRTEPNAPKKLCQGQGRGEAMAQV